MISLQKGRSVIEIDNNNNNKATPIRHYFHVGLEGYFCRIKFQNALEKASIPVLDYRSNWTSLTMESNMDNPRFWMHACKGG